MRRLVFVSLLALAACGTTSGGGGVFGSGGGNAPLPAHGPIVYSCANGQQLTVDFENNQAQVAIVGGPSMVLQSTSPGVQNYSNGRYTLSGGGASATWDTPQGDPTQCRGS